VGTILRDALSRARGQILGWGLSLGMLAALTVAFFDTLLAQREGYEALVRSMPPEVLAFLGGMADTFSPVGYLGLYFYSYMPVVAGIYAVLAGSGLVAADEEAGTLDLLLAQPIRRAALLGGRVLALALTLAAILALTWAGFAVSAPRTGLEAGVGALALPLVSLWALLVAYGLLALLLSQILPSRSAAASTAGLVLVLDYFLVSWRTIRPELEPLARALPQGHYQGAEALGGLDFGALSVLLGAGAVCGLLALWRFQRRDIRVAGEGGWRLGGIGGRRPAAET
jgi:ABC-2 type transport system permease protein